MHIIGLVTCGVAELLCSSCFAAPQLLPQRQTARYATSCSRENTTLPQWRFVSEDAKEMIRGLLKFNQKDRCTAQQALKHRWFQGTGPQAVDWYLQSDLVENLRRFRSENKLKRAMRRIVAGKLSRTKQMEDAFMALDENCDGVIDVSEWQSSLAKAGLSEMVADMPHIVKNMSVDFTEFLAAALDESFFAQEDVCWSAFCALDRNGDGNLSNEELKSVLNCRGGQQITGTQSIADLIGEFDDNGDGLIDFREFKKMMRGSMK